MDHPAAHLARLTEYKSSRSKWVELELPLLTQPLEVYTRALGVMSDVIFVNFIYINSQDHYAAVAELVHNLPSVSSIYVSGSRRLPAIQRDTPLFINDNEPSNRIETFLPTKDNQSQLARTRHTHVFIDTGLFNPSVHPARLELWRGSKIAVSFFGPPSGNLVLKLTHSSRDAGVTLILKEPHGSRTFQYPVSSSLTVTTITLSFGLSNHPFFVPNVRNNLLIKVTVGDRGTYVLEDIQLHDEVGNNYNPASPEE
jgi:hypothetical protein